MIKRINEANAGVKRPVRVSDLQDLWNAFKLQYLNDKAEATFIVSGFYEKLDGNLSAGIVVHNGVMYYHPDTTSSRIPKGAAVYGESTGLIDMRVFEDATSQNFSYDMIASTRATGTPIGTFTNAFIEQHRNPTQYRTVEGRLAVKTTAGVGFTPAVSFTPDRAEDNDVVVSIQSVSIDPNIALISVVDGTLKRIRRNFDWVLELTLETSDNMEVGNIPTALIVGNGTDFYDIGAYYAGAYPTGDTEVDYRVKFYFDL